jgi:hypothetical protein
MKLSKRIIPILSLSLAVIILGAALGYVLINQSVNMTMRIKKTATMAIYDIDAQLTPTWPNSTGTKLATIGLGDYMIDAANDYWGYPGTSPVGNSGRINMTASEDFTQYFYVADIDQANFTVQFAATGLPDYTVCWLRAVRMDGEAGAGGYNWHEIDIQGAGSWTTDYHLASPGLYPTATGQFMLKFQFYVQIVEGQLPAPVPAGFFASYTPLLTVTGITDVPT